MPLNLKEGEESGQVGGSKSEPIIHKPKESRMVGSKAILVIVVVIVLIVVVGVVYKSGYTGMKQKSPKEEVFNQSADTAKTVPVETVVGTPPVEKPKAETTGQMGNEKPTTAKSGNAQLKPEKKSSKKQQSQLEPKAEVKPSSKPMGVGDYTIYIGIYVTKTTADEEVGRWNEAGYQAFVSELSDQKGTQYRVCLGRYTTKDEARQQAEKLKDAFEGGFWVDVVK